MKGVVTNRQRPVAGVYLAAAGRWSLVYVCQQNKKAIYLHVHV